MRVLSQEDYFVLGEEQFGVPGLLATEVIGPFVETRVAGPLIMVHDGVFEPHHGIGHHPHRFNERLFYILEGAVDHDDALNGITGHMGTGDMGRLTEGARGMLHKEWNNTDGRARAFILVYETDPIPAQASFTPLRDADAPRYAEADGVQTKELVGGKVNFPLHGDIRYFADSVLGIDASLEIELAPEEGALLYPLEGELEVEEDASGRIAPGQAVLLSPEPLPRRVRLRAAEESRLLRVVFGPGREGAA
jgi:redox-sensitive bicupin YhaK (pirin superfamily)